MSRALVLAISIIAVSGTLHAQDADSKRQERITKIRALDWVEGPKQITIAGNSTLSLPEGYLYLDPGQHRQVRGTQSQPLRREGGPDCAKVPSVERLFPF